MLVSQLVSESMDMRDFIQSTEITSPNGRLVVDLVQFINSGHPDEMPKCFKNILANICKPTSVRGLLQA